MNKRVAYFGGTFDPVHNGHLEIAKALFVLFELDRFYFLPAFHAPHKPDTKPTSEFHRYAMLCLATQDQAGIAVSTLEIEKQEKRYTIDTLAELKDIHPKDKVFFVMGADSWRDIKTWKEWEKVLLACNHIVVTRPGYPINIDHVSDRIRERIIDLRSSKIHPFPSSIKNKTAIYITDAVVYNTSATELREDLADGTLDRRNDIPLAVAKYIEKYELYK
ncbi:nicotinate-nucleotide adenylyltransferase [Leptolyngbya sp. 7M]|uniref:nicotinate-nucleotide adenylyltransferase n=1 Tax=Leptolyngbya sp. 7M TaxID=2812896 RepID=UPI001B8C5908|nr:nicotinate-nucleotide adenylyltransferase [Leptolyngbya sp. 7M]QYO63896.1 nicotinate-nucleotide adenylyltransferase [Leptolyngbya sp. 7M]